MLACAHIVSASVILLVFTSRDGGGGILMYAGHGVHVHVCQAAYRLPSLSCLAPAAYPASTSVARSASDANPGRVCLILSVSAALLAPRAAVEQRLLECVIQVLGTCELQAASW
jgi:hypothetical protein